MLIVPIEMHTIFEKRRKAKVREGKVTAPTLTVQYIKKEKMKIKVGWKMGGSCRGINLLNL